MIDEARLKELLTFHAELCGALILAGKRIRLLNFGKQDDKAPPILRRVLRESRLLARKFNAKSAVSQ